MGMGQQGGLPGQRAQGTVPAAVDGDEAEEFALAVSAVSQLFVEISARSLASVDSSLTLPQLRALVVLDRCGPVKLAALAAELGVNPSTALRMVERLETQDLAHRAPNPGNRREVVLRMSEKGRAVVDEVLKHRRAEVCALVGRLPATERPRVVAALRALAAAAAEGGPVGADAVGRLGSAADDPSSPAAGAATRDAACE